MRQPRAQPPLGSVQLFTQPWRQKKQSPQKVSTFTVTRSPGRTVVTPAPTCSTMPTISWPTVMPGTARGTEPCLMCRSLVQMLPSVTLTMASRSFCKTGLGLSSRAKVPRFMYVYASIQHTSFCMYGSTPRRQKPAPRHKKSPACGVRRRRVGIASGDRGG